MKDKTIKSVTHCPTCGSECKVEGNTTQYYKPVKKYTEADIRKAIKFGQIMEQLHEYVPISDFINSLNKQD